MHTYADTWSHEGFTAWENASINTRPGGYWTIPAIGHAHTPEMGKAPDKPYNDVPKALEAAWAIFELIPDKCLCGGWSRSTIDDDLGAAFAFRGNEGGRISNMQKLITSRFKFSPTYQYSK